MSTLSLRQSRLSITDALRVSALPAADGQQVYRSGAVSSLSDLTDTVTPAGTAAPGCCKSSAPTGELRTDGDGPIARTGPLVVPVPVHLPRVEVSPVQFTPAPIIPTGQITLKRPASSPAPTSAPMSTPTVAAPRPSAATTLLAALGSAIALFL